MDTMVSDFRSFSSRELSAQAIEALNYRHARWSDWTGTGKPRYKMDGVPISPRAQEFVLLVEGFAYQRQQCFYCGSALVGSGLDWRHNWDGEDEYLQCSVCQWSCFSETWATMGGASLVALLRAFDVTSRDENLQAVAGELLLNWKVVRKLHHSKLEELVAGVVRGVLDCETRWVGQSHDGGVDVIALMSDNPMAIQVKRRARRDSVEGVGVVREFCGALISKGLDKGMIVSTADHYSREAYNTANRIVCNSSISQMHLVDCQGLCDMFDLVRRDRDRWQLAFPGRRDH